MVNVGGLKYRRGGHEPDGPGEGIQGAEQGKHSAPNGFRHVFGHHDSADRPEYPITTTCSEHAHHHNGGYGETSNPQNPMAVAPIATSHSRLRRNRSPTAAITILPAIMPTA